jgi:peptide/nickel transport system substrate-binding protein
MRSALLAAWLGAITAAGPAVAAGTGEETPKYGGTLTYMIPADAPPSLDGHREGTFAMLHTVAPFYSVLMRVDQPVGYHPFRLRSLHRDSQTDG